MTHQPPQEPFFAPRTPGGLALPDTRALEALALEALENVSDAFVALDAEWRIVYVNREACRINQKPRAAFIGRMHWDEWPGAVGTEIEHQLRRAHDEQTPVHFEHRYVSDPYDVWLDINAYPTAGGGLNLFYRDISARKAGEETLRQFQFLSDNANDAFLVLDEAARFVYVNQAACRSLSYTPEQFAALCAVDINPAYDEAQYRALFLRIEGEPLPPFETRHRRADGVMIPIEASVSRVDIGGRALLFSSCRDISERKRAEAEMRRGAARQRAFLRDVLASVSEGHLLLCQTPQDLPPALPPFGEPIAISMQGGLVDLRARSLAACRSVGISEERGYDLLTAASEAGMNAAVHVGHGTAQVFADTERGTVQVWVRDQGAGISVENLPHATLKKGYTTAGTLGHGMKMMLQTADRLFLLTGSAGTTVVLEMDCVVAPAGF